MGKVVSFTPEGNPTLKDDLKEVIEDLEDLGHTSYVIMTWDDGGLVQSRWNNRSAIPSECVPEYLKQHLRKAQAQ